MHVTANKFHAHSWVTFCFKKKRPPTWLNQTLKLPPLPPFTTPPTPLYCSPLNTMQTSCNLWCAPAHSQLMPNSSVHMMHIVSWSAVGCLIHDVFFVETWWGVDWLLVGQRENQVGHSGQHSAQNLQGEGFLHCTCVSQDFLLYMSQLS